MYYVDESEKLYQTLVSINKNDHDIVLQQLNYILDAWERQFEKSRLLFAAPSEIMIYLNYGNYDKNDREILFDHRSIDYNRLTYFKMRILLDSEHYEDSVTFANDVEKYNPVNTDLKVLKAYAFFMMDDYEAVLYHASKTLMISFEPSQIGHCIWLMGKAYEMLGRGELAYECYMECDKWVDGIRKDISALSETTFNRNEKSQISVPGDELAEAFVRILKNTCKNGFEKIFRHFALTLLRIDAKSNLYGCEDIENIQDKETILKREYLIGEMEKYIS